MTNLLSISETDQGRAFWLAQGLARQHHEQVAAAHVLIVPIKDFRDGVPFVFHQDTAALSRFLAEHLNGQATIEVLADDDEYTEIALHGAVHRFSTLVVSFVVAPLVINLLSDYLYDILKAKPSDSVEMNIVIEDHECRAMRVDFKGEAKDFALVADKIGLMSRDCMSAARAHGHPHTTASTPVVILPPPPAMAAPATTGFRKPKAAKGIPATLQQVQPPESSPEPGDSTQEGRL